MSLWLQRSHGDHSYWDVAAANFKHAIGLCCELVVEHVNSFIHSGEPALLFEFLYGGSSEKSYAAKSQPSKSILKSYKMCEVLCKISKMIC